MFAIESMIIIAIIMFVVGCGMGVLISRTFVPPTQQRELETSLQEARTEMDKYQQNVAAHFVETSARITNLTDSYRDLHQHLAKGALDLTSSEISQQVIEAGDKDALPDSSATNSDSAIHALSDNSIVETEFSQPKDWAPKEPGQMGTLSEEFGLTENKDTAGIEVTSVHPPMSDKKEPEA